MKARHKLDLFCAALCLKAGPVLGVDAADLHDTYHEYLQQTLADERAAVVRDTIANDQASAGVPDAYCASHGCARPRARAGAAFCTVHEP